MNNRDLPFFSELMLGISNKNFICPKPVPNKSNEYISDIDNKKFMIVSFLNGKSKKNLSPTDCKIIGTETAKLHEITKNFSFQRKNDLSIKSWRKIFDQVKNSCNKIHKDLPKLIEANLVDVEKNWPKNLPSGIIHADLFNDNIFFRKNEFSGFIDFYFSCNDFLIYELAICINALCFDYKKGKYNLNKSKVLNLIKGYEKVRRISINEKNSLNILCRAAALRYLLTRIYDYFNTPKTALIKVKDPKEYFQKLIIHNKLRNYKDYIN